MSILRIDDAIKIGSTLYSGYVHYELEEDDAGKYPVVSHFNLICNLGLTTTLRLYYLDDDTQQEMLSLIVDHEGL